MYFLVIIVLTIIFIIMFPKKDTESFLKKPFITTTRSIPTTPSIPTTRSIPTCSPGYYRTPTSSSNIPCPIGYYCPNANMSVPTICSSGYYCPSQKLTNQTLCIHNNCPTGSISDDYPGIITRINNFLNTCVKNVNMLIAKDIQFVKNVSN